MSQGSDKPLIMVPGAQGATYASERRCAFRYPFTAAAEVLELHSQTRVTGRCSDLGPGGCYIDTIVPFAVGTEVRIRIDRELRTFEALATVSYAHLSMGMGLAFTDIKAEHQSILNAWMSELNGGPMPEGQNVSEVRMLSPILNLQQVLNELISLMVRKNVLNENEGAALLRQLFR